MSPTRTLLLLTAVLWPLTAAAECPEPANRDNFAELSLAQVKPGVTKVFFAKDDCAPGGTTSCLTKAYVMPGDIVLVSEVLDASACATYVNTKGQVTSGLLPNDRLTAPRRLPSATGRDLIGTWTRLEAQIVIKPKGRDGTLDVDGNATFGALDPGRVKRGAVNLGEFAFVAQPTRNAFDIGLATDSKGETKPVPGAQADEFDCRVSMIALPPYLVVKDNLMCGGANVSFTGIYRRAGG